MRTLLFFDLPSVTKGDKKNHSKFVKEIKKMGFIMMQESVYVKLSLNDVVALQTISRVEKILPPSGNVSTLTITEKQFSKINHMIGEFYTDILQNEERLVEL